MCSLPEITVRKSNLPPWFDSEVSRLKIKKKQAWSEPFKNKKEASLDKVNKFNRVHHWEKLEK